MTALESLAAAAGIAVSWTDTDSKTRHVPLQTLRAVLAALGYPAETAAQIRASRARLKQVMTAPPLLVAGVNESFAASGRSLRLTAEDGRTHVLPVRNGKARATLLPGYYKFADGRSLAVTPPRAFALAKPAWGVGAQIYSLRGSPGFGDFGALQTFVRQTAA